MQPSRRESRIFLALCANAAVLLMILFVLMGRDSHLSWASAAPASQQSPIAGGNGMFVMPGQLSPNTWGCYLMDTDHQTLCVYQYSPSEPLLRLVASRGFNYDRLLSNFNTLPSPSDIKDLTQQDTSRVLQSTAPPESK